MRTGILAPTINEYAEPSALLDLAKVAEAAGWEGFFIWDHLVLDPDGLTPITDVTVMLGAIAAVTERMLIGPMVTPVSRRRPWKLAKELATLDRLSNGRLRFGVGIGAQDEEFANFGEDPDKKILARKTDEGLALIEHLLKGERTDHDGEAYQITNVRLLPAAVQQPRIPVWVAAMLPFKAGQRRAARWDGILAQKLPASLADGSSDTSSLDWYEFCLEPSELSTVVEFVSSLRQTDDPFDVIAYGTTYGIDRESARAKLKAYQGAGATWWCEWLNPASGTIDDMRKHIRAGPPTI